MPGRPQGALAAWGGASGSGHEPRLAPRNLGQVRELLALEQLVPGPGHGGHRCTMLTSPRVGTQVPHHRDLGLGRGSGHPGRPEGVRAPGLPRHERDRRPHGPEHHLRARRCTRRRRPSPVPSSTRSSTTSVSTPPRRGCSSARRSSRRSPTSSPSTGCRSWSTRSWSRPPGRSFLQDDAVVGPRRRGCSRSPPSSRRTSTRRARSPELPTRTTRAAGSLRRRMHALGAPAVIVTGGHGSRGRRLAL